MRSSYSRAWGLQAFHTCISNNLTYRYNGYDVTDRDHIKNKKIVPQKYYTSVKSLHTSLVHNSFSMGVKYMKASDLVSCNCKSFTYGFLGF